MKRAATAAVVSLVLLALEVAHVRLLSYVGDPRLVYAAIAIALTGMSGASVWVATRPALIEGDVDARLAKLCAALSVAVVLHAVVLARIATGFSAGSFGDVLVHALPVLVVCAVPYFIGGLALTIAVSASADVHRTWAAGLFGSAIGCFLLYPLLRRVGMEREIAALGLISALAAARRGWVAALVSLVALAIAPRIMTFEPDPRDLYGLARAMYQKVQPGGAAPTRDYAAWDPMARVEVISFPPPFGTLNDGVPIKLVTQDGGAGTILIGFGDHEDARAAWTERSVYATGYIAEPAPERVLVIGLGGGVDVVTALQHGARDVTGVEINGSILNASARVFADFQGRVLSRPGVHLVHADGRSFLEQAERRGQRWSLIQMSGADTYSAGTGGAFMFSESYLYTVDAFERYFRALDDRGVLALIRFGPEPLRAVISEARAMTTLGMKDLSRRFIVLRQGICFGILASKRPLDAEDMTRLARMIEASTKQSRVKLPMWDAMGFGIDEPLRVEYAPGRPGSYATAIDAIETGNDAKLQSLLDSLPLDYSPTTDDRPFFFQFLKPRDFTRLTAIGDRDFFAAGLLGHARLVIALLVFATVLILVPLRTAPLRERLPARRAVLVAGLLGLAYMLVELVLIQRTVLLLGHPTASVSVTIASLLIGSGIGAMKWSPRVSIPRAIAITLVALIVVEVASRPYADVLLRAPLVLRGLGVALMLVPLGIAMGMAFPALLRRADPRTQGWSIGINGLASVLGSVIATPIAMGTGFRALLIAAMVVYGAVAVTSRKLAA
jgi:hypothetical protein